MKLFIFCVDGATPKYIEKSGMTRFTRGEYHSVIPTTAENDSEWISFATGLTNREHLCNGVKTTRDSVGKSFIVDDFDSCGYTHGIYGFPVLCDPPDILSPSMGWMVGTKDTKYALNSWCKDVTLSDHEHNPNIFPSLDAMNMLNLQNYSSYVRSIHSICVDNISIALTNINVLMENNPVDVCIWFMRELDIAGHYLMDIFEDSMLDIYATAAGAIEEAIERLDPDYWIVTSCYGMTPYNTSSRFRGGVMLAFQSQFVRVDTRPPRRVETAYHDFSTHGILMSNFIDGPVRPHEFRSEIRYILQGENNEH